MAQSVWDIASTLFLKTSNLPPLLIFVSSFVTTTTAVLNLFSRLFRCDWEMIVPGNAYQSERVTFEHVVQATVRDILVHLNGIILLTKHAIDSKSTIQNKVLLKLENSGDQTYSFSKHSFL